MARWTSGPVLSAIGGVGLTALLLLHIAGRSPRPGGESAPPGGPGWPRRRHPPPTGPVEIPAASSTVPGAGKAPSVAVYVGVLSEVSLKTVQRIGTERELNAQWI